MYKELSSSSKLSRVRGGYYFEDEPKIWQKMQGLMREKDDVMIELREARPKDREGCDRQTGMSVIGCGRSGGVGH